MERLSNAALTLRRRCESENYPNVWGHPSSEGWDTRDIVITHKGNNPVVIGSFRVGRGVE